MCADVHAVATDGPTSWPKPRTISDTKRSGAPVWRDSADEGLEELHRHGGLRGPTSGTLRSSLGDVEPVTVGRGLDRVSQSGDVRRRDTPAPRVGADSDQNRNRP